MHLCKIHVYLKLPKGNSFAIIIYKKKNLGENLIVISNFNLTNISNSLRTYLIDLSNIVFTCKVFCLFQALHQVILTLHI